MDRPASHLAADRTAPAPARGGCALSRFLRELVRAPRDAAAGPPAARFRSGDVLGSLELVREIGRGGFGVVFEARDRQRGGRVAVKTARPGAEGEPARDALRREAAAARLRHPNVVEVLGEGSCEKGPYLVLERLRGETVADRLRRGPLPPREVIGVALAMARALSHAHAHGVLHRDLKPGNVFLPEAGEAKLIDFGLSTIAGNAGPPGSGTSAYMSPEQRRGEAEDERSDLFALGLLVHEMATGRPLLRRDGTRDPAARVGAAPGVPPALARIAETLAEDDPARRPRSADEVVTALRRVARGATPRREPSPRMACAAT